MKRTVLIVLLIMVMASALCACSSNSSGNQNEPVEEVEEVEEASETTSQDTELEVEVLYYKNKEDHDNRVESTKTINMTYQQFVDSIHIIPLTTDNWKEYFEDYDYTEHVIEKNEFGDIENEKDVRHFGFRAKNGVYPDDGCALKFDSYTYFEPVESGWCKTCEREHEGVQYFQSAGSTEKIGKCTNGHEWTEETEAEDYFVVKFNSWGFREFEHYSNYNCLAAVGEVVTIDFMSSVPVYYKSPDIQIRVRYPGVDYESSYLYMQNGHKADSIRKMVEAVDKRIAEIGE